MNEEHDEQHDIADDAIVDSEQWWLACPGRMLVWARLRVLDSGVAQVFDCDGQTLIYDSEDTARAALMDAEFRALDGMDDDDTSLFGMLIEELLPPEGDDDEALVPQMMVPLAEPN